MGTPSDRRLLYVPVRASASGALALHTGRLASGPRVGLAFTSAAALMSALGPGQPWIRLDEDAMLDMLEATGVSQIRIDACLAAPPAAPATAIAAAWPRRRILPYRCATLTRAHAASRCRMTPETARTSK